MKFSPPTSWAATASAAVILSSAATASWLLFNKYKTNKQRLRIQKDYEQKRNEEFQFMELLIQKITLHRCKPKHVLAEWKDFIFKHYAAQDEIPSFEMLWAFVQIHRATSYVGFWQNKMKIFAEYEQVVLQQLKKRVERTRASTRRTAQQIAKQSATAATAMAATAAAAVVNNAEKEEEIEFFTLEEQDFALKFFSRIVGIEQLKREIQEQPSIDLQIELRESQLLLLAKLQLAARSMPNSVMVQYTYFNESWEENLKILGAENNDAIHKMITLLSQDVMKNRWLLSLIFFKAAWITSDKERELQLLDMSIALFPNAVAYGYRFKNNPASNDDDIERALQLTTNASYIFKLCLPNARGATLERYQKQCQDAFADYHGIIHAAYFKHYVQEQGKIDEFIAMMKSRLEPYQQRSAKNPKYTQSTVIMKNVVFTLSVDALLNKNPPAFEEAIQSFDHAPNPDTLTKELKRIIESIRDNMTKYPIFQQALLAIHQNKLQNKNLASWVHTYLPEFSKIQLESTGTCLLGPVCTMIFLVSLRPTEYFLKYYCPNPKMWNAVNKLTRADQLLVAALLPEQFKELVQEGQDVLQWAETVRRKLQTSSYITLN